VYISRSVYRLEKLSFVIIILFIGFICPVSVNGKVFPLNTKASCITQACHSDIAKKKYIHAPSADGASCTLCHEVIAEGRHEFKAMLGDLELCLMCHDAKGFKGTTPHGPVTKGLCIVCHNPHASQNHALLEKAVPSLCLVCHEAMLKSYDGIMLPSIKEFYDDKEIGFHKPFAEGECTACHSPHPTNTYMLLKGNYPAQFYASYSEKTYELCLKCHKGMKKALSEPKTLTNTGFRNGDNNLHFVHVNKKKGRTCKACHLHHGSKNQRLIRDTFPFGQRMLTITYEKTESGGSCTPACHTTAKYNRYKTVFNPIKTSQRPVAVDKREEYEGEKVRVVGIEETPKLNEQKPEQTLKGAATEESEKVKQIPEVSITEAPKVSEQRSAADTVTEQKISRQTESSKELKPEKQKPQSDALKEKKSSKKKMKLAKKKKKGTQIRKKKK